MPSTTLSMAWRKARQEIGDEAVGSRSVNFVDCLVIMLLDDGVRLLEVLKPSLAQKYIRRHGLYIFDVHKNRSWVY